MASQDEALKQAAEKLLQLLQSEGWKILMTHARFEIKQARDELETVDPEAYRQINKLQQEIAIWRAIPGKVDELIKSGLQSELLEEVNREFEADGSEDDIVSE